jgi:hypothetical protein
MVSMPSAMTTASVRSAWSRTVLMMWAAPVVVRPEQPHVQLDQVGADERQHGQGGRGGADVVQGHPPAGPAGLGDGGQQPGRVADQGPLGHLDHHPQAPLGLLDGRLEVVGAGDAQRDRLGVDEQGQRRAQPAAGWPR